MLRPSYPTILLACATHVPQPQVQVYPHRAPMYRCCLDLDCEAPVTTTYRISVQYQGGLRCIVGEEGPHG